MSESNTSSTESERRQVVANALLDSPDIESVLRLTVVKDKAEKTLVVAAGVAMVETLPNHVISHALRDAKRRVKEALGEECDVFLEPDLVRDPDWSEPETDVIVIRASD
ncbi:hypothetical protein [Pontimonas sp.]|jgi:hypothetical protein|uniref:hypothetical protein n=1 Tax=Pontimonas sp. TaxID=2304492 RepID=UPI0028705AD8|nr:hypothetical protein [Pontimonas sp.]MDR9396175.1 hypothetical protein [Pontimonas sp.]MDR9434534.1 hypothetical protein [Pontimonas sp.]